MNAQLPRLTGFVSSCFGGGRRWRRASLGFAAAAGLTGLCVTPSAQAQSSGALDGEFSVQRFNPAPGSRNFITTRGVRHEGNMSLSLGLMASYAYKPFVLRSCLSETNCDDANAVQRQDIPVVESLFTGDLWGALVIIPRLQVSLRVPVTYSKGQGLSPEGRPAVDGLSGLAPGDAELEGKFRFYGEPSDTMNAGVAVFATGPLGHAVSEGAYIGDTSPGVGGRLIFDGMSGPFSVGLNLGGLWREAGRAGSVELGPELRYGVAAGYKVSPLLRVVADGFGSTKFSSRNGTNALEIDGAVQVTPSGSPLVVTAGAGTGVVQGVGVPLVRGFLGVGLVFDRPDQDGDGIPDDEDQCPTVAEDMNGVEDSDGCPEGDLDSDGDGIPDSKDKCPSDPEDLDGFEDGDGCPEPGDGSPAVVPVADRDKDGVPDERDQCPDEPEDTDGFQDEDGCPDPDNDGDGIPDIKDECIDEPETMNGFEDEDGCPDVAPNQPKAAAPAPKLVEVTAEGIQILQRVEFENNKSKIKGKQSFAVLDAVVAVLKSNPGIKLVEVQGHTDNKGVAANNKKLSQERAEAVKKYLVGKGIAAERLTAVGYGDEQPVADNKTDKGRATNRRVEFKILQR